MIKKPRNDTDLDSPEGAQFEEDHLGVVPDLDNPSAQLIPLRDARVTRFEVIDSNIGRVYVARSCKVRLSYQDNGQTLKVFVELGEKS